MKKCPKRIDKMFSKTHAAPQKTLPPQCCRMCPAVIPRSPCVNVALIWWWGRWWWWWWWRWWWWWWCWWQWWSDLWNEGVALSKKTRWGQFELLQIFLFLSLIRFYFIKDFPKEYKQELGNILSRPLLLHSLIFNKSKPRQEQKWKNLIRQDKTKKRSNNLIYATSQTWHSRTNSRQLLRRLFFSK